MTGKRIHLRLDSVHPLGACHHQKIAVIDDALAFCGGIDLTVGRWDTPEHRDEDRRRASPWGFAQPPWHDATAAVDGEAAQSLAELARERWESATGERLPPLSERHAIWPQTLQTTFHDVNVGIVRTQPKSDGQTEVREVEALTLAAIARAHRFIYVESQT
ncbi:Cardiolipin synthase B [Methylobacterium isbiliense]|uniref:Cardiolipin synthase B n=2 Tax=Methylobacterium isbiliense TaxID=315478 RepID=A0ABQ4SS61_9HYPH|nr:Cardiolipin synthase B [Methylobacterium isbiliense]